MLGISELVRDKKVVAAIDFHRTSIYATDASHGQWPEHIVAADPHGHFHKIHHRAGNPNGTYEADGSRYWREITEALAPAGEILILGHGTGKADAAHQWLVYAENHRRDVAAKVVAEVHLDLDRLDDAQVLRLAQHYFDGIPASLQGPVRRPGVRSRTPRRVTKIAHRALGGARGADPGANANR